MEKNTYLFTSESVTEGHPDKICDQISDAILDEILAKDKNARVACETMTTTGLVLVAGEISTDCYVDIPKIVRKTVSEIGYTRAKYGFDAETCSVLTAIHEQSPDIAMGVDEGLESKQNTENLGFGAGDQGLMFGYACDETEEYMPLSLVLAHKICQRLSYVRKENILPLLRPDGKSSVTVEYAENGEILGIHTVLVSSQHDEAYSYADLYEDIKREVIEAVVPAELLKNARILINPTGRFVVGGPMGDTGLTGRKIIVDTYGGVSAHGGGAFSGKDPTKVDRSAAYMARYVAKNCVAAGLSKKMELQLAYAIGVARPISINVNTFGTGKISDRQLEKIIAELFPLTPSGIIEHLNLCRPIYRQTASYGHFGRNELDLPWEKLDFVDKLKAKLTEIQSI